MAYACELHVDYWKCSLAAVQVIFQQGPIYPISVCRGRKALSRHYDTTSDDIVDVAALLCWCSRTGYVGEGKKAFLRLKREVLDMILLRRTKSNRSNDICLPPRIVRVRQHRLDEREEVRS